jgi:(heptosyl)LPS beta-1,4-glucosyltransferase
VGLLVLARNEEAAIARCLDSVAAGCDELVVVDMASEDETASIARSFGAEVLSVPVVHRYDGMRQVGLEYLKSEWVLQLDADEWAPDLLRSVRGRRLMERGRPLAVPKINYLNGVWIKSNRWWPNRQVRLFPRCGARYTDTFHAHLEVHGKPLNLPASPEFAIHHGGYEDADEMLRSVARFLPPERHPLTRTQALRAVGRPLAGYVTSRAWREGSDGLAILAAKIVNATAKESSL